MGGNGHPPTKLTNRDAQGLQPENRFIAMGGRAAAGDPLEAFEKGHRCLKAGDGGTRHSKNGQQIVEAKQQRKVEGEK
ncbi:MAG: hypothetical protein IPM82_31930 [Saprospiraceae bacterium]|nr:hypothetical protein [Saprospiraceae bacterium]